MSNQQTKKLLSSMRTVSRLKRFDFSEQDEEALAVSAFFAAAWNAQANKVCSRCGNFQLSWRSATGTVTAPLAPQTKKFIKKWFHNPVRKLLLKCLREELREGESHIAKRLEDVAEKIVEIVNQKKFIKDLREKAYIVITNKPKKPLRRFNTSKEKKNILEKKWEDLERYRYFRKEQKEIREERIETFYKIVQDTLKQVVKGTSKNDEQDRLKNLVASMEALFTSILHSEKKLRAAGTDLIPMGIPVDKKSSSAKETTRDQAQGNSTEEQTFMERIEKEIMTKSPNVKWEDIAGLKIQKDTIKQAVVNPMLRPDLYIGLRKPPTGILLFGPPGTGKTLLGKAIATECDATFFSISTSSLISKYYGESEKLIRALFAVARKHQPSVIFIDEIDSLLKSRESNSSEGVTSSVKNEFFVQMDGVGGGAEDRVLVVGATNLPHELDEAARRRLATRLYIPLPDSEGRKALIKHSLEKVKNNITEPEFEPELKKIVQATQGYSGSDLQNLCRESSLEPLHDHKEDFLTVEKEEIRPVEKKDFDKSMRKIRASVNQAGIQKYEEWNKQFGLSLEVRKVN